MTRKSEKTIPGGIKRLLGVSKQMGSAINKNS